MPAAQLRLDTTTAARKVLVPATRSARTSSSTATGTCSSGENRGQALLQHFSICMEMRTYKFYIFTFQRSKIVKIMSQSEPKKGGGRQYFCFYNKETAV